MEKEAKGGGMKERERRVRAKGEETKEKRGA